MTTKMRIASFVLLFTVCASVHAENAKGLGVNVPLVGRLFGGGATLFITAIDVANHSSAAVPVDFYLDGQEIASGASIAIDGSIDSAGRLVARGDGGQVRARSNMHFDDFVDAVIKAGFLPESVRTNGFIGSALFVFGGSNRSGVGSVTARFYNASGEGFVGVSLKGREITTNEPRSLVAAVLDTRSNTAGAPKMYPNLFINNTGLTPTGTGVAGAVTVEISAIANSSGQAIGTPITLTNLGPGRTVVIGDVLNSLRVPSGTENTVLVFARVVSGNAAIHGIVSQVDNATRDGSVFDMSRADF